MSQLWYKRQLPLWDGTWRKVCVERSPYVTLYNILPISSDALSAWELGEDQASLIAKKLWKQLRKACRLEAESAADFARMLSALLSLPAFVTVAHQGSVNGADTLLANMARRLTTHSVSHVAYLPLRELAARFKSVK